MNHNVEPDSALPRVLGITGGIGAGKSFVARNLQPFIPVFDCDSAGKEAYTARPDLTKQLKQLLGADAYQGDVPQFPVIARCVFSDSALLKRVEEIIHPFVREQFLLWRSRCAHTPCDWVGLESAILIEKGFDALCDAVLYVQAPTQLRLSRAQARDHTSAEALLRRIRAQQFLAEQYNRRPLWIFENSAEGLPPHFPAQLKAFLQSVPPQQTHN